MPIPKGSRAPHRAGCRCICCESSDILGKLDRYPMVSCGSPELVRAAAEEIRRLRNEIAALRQEETA